MSVNFEILLLAIAMVESGNNPAAIGRHGERTQYQITKAVWQQHSKSRHGDSRMARAVARRHLEAIDDALPHECKDNPFWLAVAWNSGVGTVRKSKRGTYHMPERLPKAVLDYAMRVTNLYESTRWIDARTSRKVPSGP